MDTTIYDKIEKEIKSSDSYMREYFITNILSYIFLILFSATVTVAVLYSYIGWIVFAGEIVILIFTYQFINFKIVYEISHLRQSDKTKPINVLKKTDIFHFNKINQTAKKLKKDKPAILEIIKKYGITTKDGLKEVIEHYRFKVNTSKQLPIDFFTVFASAISIGGFIFNNDTGYIKESTIVFVCVLIIVLLVYIWIICLTRITFAKFSKKTFYAKIECALSEVIAMDKLTSSGTKENNAETSDLIDITE